MIFKCVVVKVTNACNLNCRYCYVFNKGDKSYQKEPINMSAEVINQLLYRIKNHCEKHSIEQFLVIFHGGEPLLRNKDFYTYFVKTANELIKHTHIEYALQTNGVLLHSETCEFLNELNIQVGISLDGPEESNQNRILRSNGEPAFPLVMENIKNTHKFFSYGLCVLSVINTDVSPAKVYDFYKKINAKVQFLFPDENYCTINDTKLKVSSWLNDLFDIWYNDDEKLQFEPFTMIFKKMLGAEKCGNEIFGLGLNDVLNIRTNGDIEAVDSLKICGDGITKSNLNVSTHDFDDVYINSLIYKYYHAHQKEILNDTCVKCEILNICGGGQLAHRFSNNNSFKNTSIYCNDIKNFVSHVQNVLIDSLPSAFVEKHGLVKYSNNICI